MERQHNGFANGVKHKIDNYIESSRVISSCQGYSEVDRGIPASHAAALDQLSPIRASSPNKRNSPVGMRIAAYNQQNKSYSSVSSSSPKSFSVNGTFECKIVYHLVQLRDQSKRHLYLIAAYFSVIYSFAHVVQRDEHTERLVGPRGRLQLVGEQRKILYPAARRAALRARCFGTGILLQTQQQARFELQLVRQQVE